MYPSAQQRYKYSGIYIKLTLSLSPALMCTLSRIFFYKFWKKSKKAPLCAHFPEFFFVNSGKSEFWKQKVVGIRSKFRNFWACVVSRIYFPEFFFFRLHKKESTRQKNIIRIKNHPKRHIKKQKILETEHIRVGGRFSIFCRVSRIFYKNKKTKNSGNCAHKERPKSQSEI